MCALLPTWAALRCCMLPPAKLRDPRSQRAGRAAEHFADAVLIAQGVDVRTVASLLGHSQASTTLDIYAHAFDKKKREAQEKLGQVMGL